MEITKAIERVLELDEKATALFLRHEDIAPYFAVRRMKAFTDMYNHRQQLNDEYRTLAPMLARALKKALHALSLRESSYEAIKASGFAEGLRDGIVLGKKEAEST